MKKIPKVKYGFLNEVQKAFPAKVSKNYISMVRRGLRTNDSLLYTIIEVDHNWKKINYDRIKNITK